MNCATHPQNVANAYCRTCGKALCPQCQHNVRGVIYCEDCLASRLGDAAPPPPPTVGQVVLEQGLGMPPGTRVSGSPSPGLAAFLGFIPGVGAMYNGQFGKAIAHLFVFIALCYAAGRAGIFGILIPFWIFYMIWDAYRTAHARELGQPVPADPFGFEGWWMSDSARAAQAAATASTAGGSAAERRAPPAMPVGAVILIGLGILFLLGNMNVFQWYYFDRFWSVILIAIGVWLFTRRRARYNCDCQRCQTRGLMGPAVLITLGTLFLLDELHSWPFGRSFPILFIVIGAVLIMRRNASEEGHREQIPPAPPATPPAQSAGSQQGNGGTEVRNG